MKVFCGTLVAGVLLLAASRPYAQVPQSAAPAPAPAGAPTAGPTRSYPPVATLAQLMRGIFFPNSNLIFTVQTHDPAEPVKRATTDPNAGFSWVDWGAGIYTGWELVENAAVALADTSPLMLSPGLRCENGRPAPITDAAWIKYTDEMVAVAKQMYKLAQSKNQEAVSDATGDLADACANCHRAYRDVGPGRGRGAAPADPTAKGGGRCMPR